jgi:hypothetical protein
MKREITRAELESRMLRIAYRGGKNKLALAYMILQCAHWQWKIPDWVRDALLDAWRAHHRGELKSWDDIFGKLYGGKQRRRVQTLSYKWDVWLRVTELRDKGEPLNDALYDRVANELRIGVGGKTVKNLYQGIERVYRRERGPYDRRNRPKFVWSRNWPTEG